MKIIRFLDKYLEEVLLLILLVLMTVIMGVQVVCRYCFNYSLTWSEELVRYLFIWAGFLSIGYCVKKKISIRITQAEALLTPKAQAIVDIFRNALLVCFFVYMLPYAMRYLQQCINNGSTSSSMGIPMYLIQCAPLVGFVLAAIRLFQCIVENVNLLRKGEIS